MMSNRIKPVNRTKEEWEAREWWPAPFIVSHNKRYWHVPIIEPQTAYDHSTHYSLNACGRDGEYRYIRSVRRRGTELKPRSGKMCKGCLKALERYYDWEEDDGRHGGLDE